MLKSMELYSIYLHIPFCAHRCSYCDFNTYAGMEAEIPAYVDALCIEMAGVAQAAGEVIPVHTIYLGGGTPSLLPLEQHEKLLSTIKRLFNLSSDAEISLEANPGTVSKVYLQRLHEIGYNRISLGMQTSNPESLRLLERQHNTVDVIKAVEWSREAGFRQINLDLIFGLPGQSLEQWQASLEFTIRVLPEHLSLYGLTIEPGTPLFRWISHGLVGTPDTDLAADMYEWAMERLKGAGFVQYEISNWAKPAKNGNLLACRHNLQYWNNRPYLGFGAGAHGYVNQLHGNPNHALYQNDVDHVIRGIRTENVLRISDYIRKVRQDAARSFPQSPANRAITPIDLFTEMQETMMVGLRLTESGVSEIDFQNRFDQSMAEVFGVEIKKSELNGLLEWVGEKTRSLRLTQRGRMLGNQVFMDFVGEKQPRKHHSTNTTVP